MGGEKLKTAGIICEYNPMHNGHVYHIEKTRQAGATHIVCVMSGNFVQRGSCAFLDSQSRADIAINCGADLVVSLPEPWSCDSAQNFAFGGVSLLSFLGVDMISFASECDDVQMLKNAADAADNPEVIKILQENVKRGASYPASLYDGICRIYGRETADIFSLANSTLGAEYIKAANRAEKKMDIFVCKRLGAKHDEMQPSGNFMSSSMIRSLKDFSDAKDYMPRYAFEKCLSLIESGLAPCENENAQRAILSALRSCSREKIASFVPDKRGLSDRIYNASKTACSLDELFETVKTKNITMAKVRRSVMRTFLEIGPEMSLKKPPYIRVLAANKKGFEILKNANTDVPIVTKHSDFSELSDFAKEVYKTQCRASDLFGLFSKKIRACGFEQTSSVIIKNN